jgi:hypothetical protein
MECAVDNLQRSSDKNHHANWGGGWFLYYDIFYDIFSRYLQGYQRINKKDASPRNRACSNSTLQNQFVPDHPVFQGLSKEKRRL